MMKNIEHSHLSLSIMEHVEQIVFHFLLEEIYHLVFYPYTKITKC